MYWLLHDLLPGLENGDAQNTQIWVGVCIHLRVRLHYWHL